MIGDWAEINLSPSTHPNGFFTSKIEVSNLVSIENKYDFDARPIPLTEEILKANGFEYDKEMYAMIFRISSIEIYICIEYILNSKRIRISINKYRMEYDTKMATRSIANCIGGHAGSAYSSRNIRRKPWTISIRAFVQFVFNKRNNSR